MAITKVKVKEYDIKDLYVSFDIAHMLKKINYDEPCNAYYRIGKNEFNLIDGYAKNSTVSPSYIMAPTIQEILRWLRKEGIHIEILFDPDTVNGSYYAGVYYTNKIYEWESEYPYMKGERSYVSVANEIIKYTLDYIY